jgi:pimeloyl-ACP methyl ester carboxylesterase
MALALSIAAAATVPAAAAVPDKPVIVLVHGAFADAAGWGPVISILQHDGYDVVAVENPLQSLDGDVANTRRVVDDQNRPVVLVGHSYGGAVITGAAALMLDTPEEKARACRVQAALSTSPEVQAVLLKLAEYYEDEARKLAPPRKSS